MYMLGVSFYALFSLIFVVFFSVKIYPVDYCVGTELSKLNCQNETPKFQEKTFEPRNRSNFIVRNFLSVGIFVVKDGAY